MPEQEKTEEKIITIPLVWGDFEDIPTIYANEMFISHAGSEFFIVLGEVAPISNLNKETPPEHIEIKPVAKIAITPKNMLRFAKAIEENVSKFKDKSNSSESD